MNENIYEVEPMTDKQADTNRNDLMIEKAKQVITNPNELKTLITQYEALKH